MATAGGTPSALTVENVRDHNFLTGTELYQFKCPEASCLRVFWRRVEVIKPVACCRECKKNWKKRRLSNKPGRLKALAKEDMVGYARFECSTPDCGNVFTNNRAMYKEWQPCRKCRQPLYPCTDLRPPPKRYGTAPRGYNRRREHVHECSACKTGRCLVEQMRQSGHHVSTGSTIATLATTQLTNLDRSLANMVGGDEDFDYSNVYEVQLKSIPDLSDPSVPFYGRFYLLMDGVTGPDDVDPPPTIPEEDENDA